MVAAVSVAAAPREVGDVVKNEIHKYLTSEDIQNIESSVQTAEAKTTGEIVPVIVKHSAGVGHVPFMLTMILLLFVLFMEFPWEDTLFVAPWVYLWPVIGVVCFLMSLFLGRFHWVQRVLTPNRDEIEHVNRRAQLEFFLNGVNKTQRSTGILIFVSVMERRAVILADEAISKKIDNKVWEELVEKLTKHLRDSNWSKAFTETIADCGKILAEHFPAQGPKQNQLSNNLVIKD